jgi:hypothetical protein
LPIELVEGEQATYGHDVSEPALALAEASHLHRDTLIHRAPWHAELFAWTAGSGRSVVTIHDGLGREQRKKAEEGFKHDPAVRVLLATDSAGEAITLQRAHLVVNYDLPWNPNRLA